jgi:hypothetical protein
MTSRDGASLAEIGQSKILKSDFAQHVCEQDGVLPIYASIVDF